MKKNVNKNKKKMQREECSLLFHVLLIYSGVARAPADQGQECPKNYRISKFVAGSFGLDSILPTDGGILGPCFR